MVTRVEHIPIELWLLIFSYLEAHDLFGAFSNLNNYFHQLLSSRYLLYNVQFKKNDYSSLISIIHCSSNVIFNRIISLQWIAKPQYGYLPKFINKNLSNLTRLRSLRIEIYPRQTCLICKILPDLHSLEYLSIKSENIQTLLIETVFTLPSLRLCELINSYKLTNVECSLNGQSNMEMLYLTNISIGVDSLTNSFFDHLLNLKKLEISGSIRTFKDLSSWIVNQYFILQRIPIIKMKCKSNRPTIAFFEQFQQIIPMIKCFSFQIYIDIEDEILLESLTNHWCSMIEQIEKINISIRISKRIDTADDDIQKRFIMYCNILVSKINQSCKIIWTQTERPVYEFTAEIVPEE